MIEKDYLFRPLFVLLNEIKAKFSTFKDTINQETLDLRIDELYKDYLNKTREAIVTADITNIIQQLSQEKSGFDKIEILAILLYHDAFINNKDKKKQLELLEKAALVFNYLNEKSNTFSMERANYLKKIQEAIRNLS
jgi:hypothetical protein